MCEDLSTHIESGVARHLAYNPSTVWGREKRLTWGLLATNLAPGSVRTLSQGIKTGIEQDPLTSSFGFHTYMHGHDHIHTPMRVNHTHIHTPKQGAGGQQRIDLRC